MVVFLQVFLDNQPTKGFPLKHTKHVQPTNQPYGSRSTKVKRVPKPPIGFLVFEARWTCSSLTATPSGGRGWLEVGELGGAGAGLRLQKSPNKFWSSGFWKCQILDLRAGGGLREVGLSLSRFCDATFPQVRNSWPVDFLAPQSAWPGSHMRRGQIIYSAFHGASEPQPEVGAGSWCRRPSSSLHRPL